MYLDANFFIIARLEESEKGARACKILQSIEKGTPAVTSSLVLDEVMRVLVKNKKKENIRPLIEDVYRMKNLTVKQVSGEIPLKALSYMEQHNLRPRDAFHVAIMRELGEDTIVSDDADFDKIKGIKRLKI